MTHYKLILAKDTVNLSKLTTIAISPVLAKKVKHPDQFTGWHSLMVAIIPFTSVFSVALCSKGTYPKTINRLALASSFGYSDKFV